MLSVPQTFQYYPHKGLYVANISEKILSVLPFFVYLHGKKKTLYRYG